MSKLIRSLLASGLVVVGVAACGDDVVITPPPPPPTPAVNSVSVAPTVASVQHPGTVQFVASVNADVGVATTVAWTSSDLGKATVGAATGLATSVAAGSAGITACSSVAGFTGVCGSASLTVTATPTATVTSVTVTPGSPAIVKGSTLQLVGAVLGTNSPSQTINWQASPNPAVATVVTGSGAGSGVVTAVGGGTTSITGCATVTGFTTVCGSAAVTVLVPEPATINIESVTNTICSPACAEVPVVLTAVTGQIQVNLNLNPGAFTVTKAQALIGGTVVAEQTFTAPAAGQGGSGNAVSTITLSLNTRQVRKLANGLFVPVIFNGPQAVTAQIFVSGNPTPISSNAIPVVMTNADAWVAGTTPVLVQSSSLPTFTTAGPTVWYRSSVNFVGGGNYISFFPRTPAITFASSICGTSANAIGAGTPTTGIGGAGFGGTFTCGSPAEGAVAITVGQGTVTPGATPAVPADVIFTAAGATTSVGTLYTVNGDSRWNLLGAGTLALGNAINVDFLAPVASWLPIGFLSGGAAPSNCELTGVTPGCWIKNSYNLKNRLVVTDGGTLENASARAIYTWAVSGVSPFYTCLAALPTGTGADFAETSTANAYQVCGSSADNIGNVSNFPASNRFSNDNTAPILAYIGGYAVATVNPPEVNVLPLVTAAADTLNFSLTDGNSGLAATVGLAVTFTRTLNTAIFPAAGVQSSVACSNPVNTLTGSGNTPQTMLTPYLISTCLLAGERKWSAVGTDRAGNTAGPIARQLEFNPLAPVINAVNIIPNYAAGTITNLDVLATDDEDLRSAEMWLHTTTNLNNDIRVVFGPKAGLFSGIWGADWDASLFFATTLGTTARLALPASYALSGYVESPALFAVVSPLQAPTDTLSVNVYDTFGAASGATIVPVNGAFVTTASYSAAGTNPWSAGLGLVFTPAINTVGTTCNFEYSTPTNNPEVFTRIWVMNEAAGQYTLLADVNSVPTLITDNGIQRLYRYSISGSATCANAGGTGVAANNIIAIKSNVGAIIF